MEGRSLLLPSGLDAGGGREEEEGPVVAEGPVGDSGYYQPGAEDDDGDFARYQVLRQCLQTTAQGRQ